jgi:hypothetical protein
MEAEKWANHWAGLSLWFGYYNFCHVHRATALHLRWKREAQTTHGQSKKCLARLASKQHKSQEGLWLPRTPLRLKYNMLDLPKIAEQ